jgi:hypothetical protein
MFEQYIGKNYKTKWDGFFILLPEIAHTSGSEYVESISVYDDATLVNTDVYVSFKEKELVVSYDKYVHKLSYLSLDMKLSNRVQMLLSNGSMFEI